jgi:conjugal transfer pilus assembly protein TraU
MYSPKMIYHIIVHTLQSYCKKIILFLCCCVFCLDSHAASNCTGRFVNPITDVCWKCVLPITIGSNSTFKGESSCGRDIKNPKNSVCICTKQVGKVKLPVPGLALGFWEPIRLVDVTRTPYCLVNLGGTELISNSTISGVIPKGAASKKSDGRNYHNYHVHSYIYPLLYWFELLTDMGCLEAGSFDLGYMSEFDPSWDNEFLSVIMAPESILFANPLAQLSCVADAIASTIRTPIDSMFWCAGAVGSLYPLGGRVIGAAGGIQASVLLTMRVLTKEHRTGLALVTSSDTDQILDGPLCEKKYSYTLKKSQYKLQMTYPLVPQEDSKYKCVPLGMSDILYNSGLEFKGGGEDFGFLLWRKKNCCFL